MLQGVRGTWQQNAPLNLCRKKIGWNFDNTYPKLPTSCCQKLNLTPAKNPQLIITE